MKLHELITEVRSNPAKNIKIHPIEVITKLYNETTDYIAGVKNLFVTLTELEKIGINPKTIYTTPVGIYLWPASFVIDWFKAEGSVSPYGTVTHINILKIKGNVINLGKVSEQELQKYYQMVVGMIDDNEIPEFEDVYNQYNEQGGLEGETDVDLPGYKLYNLVGAGAEFIFPDTAHYNAWSHLFRKLGIDGIIDSGDGIIYDSHTERTQAIIFQRNSISGTPISLVNPDATSDLTHPGAEKFSDRNVKELVYFWNKKDIKNVLKKIHEIRLLTPGSYDKLSNHIGPDLTNQIYHWHKSYMKDTNDKNWANPAANKRRELAIKRTDNLQSITTRTDDTD